MMPITHFLLIRVISIDSTSDIDPDIRVDKAPVGAIAPCYIVRLHHGAWCDRIMLGTNDVSLSVLPSGPYSIRQKPRLQPQVGADLVSWTDGKYRTASTAHS